MTRTVSFGEVQVRKYAMILGDNPATKSGLPLTIGWSPITSESAPLDMYEYLRRGERRGRPKRLGSGYRRDYLYSQGIYSNEDFVRVLTCCMEIQESRMRSAGAENRFLFNDRFSETSAFALKSVHKATTNAAWKVGKFTTNAAFSAGKATTNAVGASSKVLVKASTAGAKSIAKAVSASAEMARRPPMNPRHKSVRKPPPRVRRASMSGAVTDPTPPEKGLDGFLNKRKTLRRHSMIASQDNYKQDCRSLTDDESEDSKEIRPSRVTVGANTA